MTELVKKLKIALNTVTESSHMRAIEVIVEGLGGVYHQLVQNIRNYTNQIEENHKPVLYDSYFAVEKST